MGVLCEPSAEGELRFRLLPALYGTRVPVVKPFTAWPRHPPRRTARCAPTPAATARRSSSAARALVAEHGVEAQIHDVAREAGVGVGTVYRHFPTKDALMGELISLCMRENAADRARGGGRRRPVGGVRLDGPLRAASRWPPTPPSAACGRPGLRRGVRLRGTAAKEEMHAETGARHRARPRGRRPARRLRRRRHAGPDVRARRRHRRRRPRRLAPARRVRARRPARPASGGPPPA